MMTLTVKTTRVFMLCSLIAVGALTTACASTPTRQSTGQLVDDTALVARVKTALGKDAISSLWTIEVETFKGAVQITGFVDSEENRDQAGSIVSSVSGVDLVVNSLIVKPQDI